MDQRTFDLKEHIRIRVTRSATLVRAALAQTGSPTTAPGGLVWTRSVTPDRGWARLDRKCNP